MFLLHSSLKVLLGNYAGLVSPHPTEILDNISISSIDGETPQLLERVSKILDLMPCNSDLFASDSRLVSCFFLCLNSAVILVRAILFQKLPLFMPGTRLVVTELLEIVTSAPQHISDVLICLNFFPFQNTNFLDVQDAIDEHLANTIDNTTLPVCIKILLRGGNHENLRDTLNLIRTSFHFEANSEINIWVFLEILNTIQLCPQFTKVYIDFFNDFQQDYLYIDLWFVYALFVNLTTAKFAIEIIEQVRFSPQVIAASIRGHAKTLLNPVQQSVFKYHSYFCLPLSFLDLVELALNHQKEHVRLFGSYLVLNIFAESCSNELRALQQDVISILVSLAIKRTTSSQRIALDILESMVRMYHRDIAFHSVLISSVLPTIQNMDLSSYRRFARISVDILFHSPDELFENPEFHAFITKLFSSKREEGMNYAIICTTTLLNKFNEFQDTEMKPYDLLLRKTIEILQIFPRKLDLFFEELLLSHERSRPVCVFLKDILITNFDRLVVEANLDEPVFYLIPNLEDDPDHMLNFFPDPLSVPNEVSDASPQTLIDFDNLPYIMTNSGFRLLLDCVAQINKEDYDSDFDSFFCQNYLTLPIRMPEADKRTQLHRLIFLHNWFTQLTNAFSPICPELCLQRLVDRIDIEFEIINILKESKQFLVDGRFSHQTYGPMFMQVSKIPKNITCQQFFEKNRIYFAPPSERLLSLLSFIGTSQPVILDRLLSEYLLFLTPPVSHLYTFPKQTPDLPIIATLVNQVLQHIDADIVCTLFRALNAQIISPIYENPTNWDRFLSLVGPPNIPQCDRFQCFGYYFSLIDAHIPAPNLVEIVIFLSNLLHSGPAFKLNKTIDECQKLSHLCEEILTNQVLVKKSAKPVLSNYFSHHLTPLTAVFKMASDSFLGDQASYQSDKPNVFWTSLCCDTYKYFFSECWKTIQFSLNEIQNVLKKQKQSNPPHPGKSLKLLMDICEVSRHLLHCVQGIHESAEICSTLLTDLLRIQMKYGRVLLFVLSQQGKFFTQCASKEHTKFQKFIHCVEYIAKRLNDVAQIVKNNLPDLQSHLPPLTKTLRAFVAVIKPVMGDEVSIVPIKERKSTGKIAAGRRKKLNELNLDAHVETLQNPFSENPHLIFRNPQT